MKRRAGIALLLGISVIVALYAGSDAPAPAAVADASGNYLQNSGFEEGPAGAPSGWSPEKRASGKGTVQAVARGGRRLLRLAPNAKNADQNFPLSVGQGMAIDPFRGKRVQLFARLGAEKGATAIAGVYAIRKDGSFAEGVRLSQASTPDGALVEHAGVLAVPDDKQSLLLIVTCAVEGTSGAALFDDIVLRAWTPDRAAGAPATQPAEPLTAEITVDAARDIRTIPRTLYGTNVEWIFDGYGLWDAKRDNLNAPLVELTRELGTTLIRFPGGVFSDFYHWKNGIGPRAKRPSTAHAPGAPKSAHNFGTDEALRFADEVGARLLITVNAGTGTAAEAAEWIKYVNGSKAGQRVTWWEVGNELYGKDDSPATKAITIKPEVYAKRYLEFAKAMRAADPRIRIGAIGGESYGRYVMNGYPGWNREVLTRAGAEIDFLAVHNAYAPLQFIDRGEDVRTVYAAMLAAPLLVQGNLDTLSKQIEQFAPARAEQIRLAVTEWGPWFHAEPQSRFLDHVKTLGSALYVASVLKVFVEHPRMEVANAFKLVDNAFMGWIGLRDGQYVAKAPYYAMQMYARHFGDVLVASSATGPTYHSAGAGMVEAVPDVPYLEVVSARSTDGATLTVMAINKHFDRPIRARLALSGFAPAARGTAVTLTGTGIDANTGTQLPKIPGLNWARQSAAEPNARFHQGGPDEVKVTSTAIDDVGREFEYTFPPHSVTCLKLSRAEGTASK